jgi:hypothetical protein
MRIADHSSDVFVIARFGVFACCCVITPLTGFQKMAAFSTAIRTLIAHQARSRVLGLLIEPIRGSKL